MGLYYGLKLAGVTIWATLSSFYKLIFKFDIWNVCNKSEMKRQYLVANLLMDIAICHQRQGNLFSHSQIGDTTCTRWFYIIQIYCLISEMMTSWPLRCLPLCPCRFLTPSLLPVLPAPLSRMHIHLFLLGLAAVRVQDDQSKELPADLLATQEAGNTFPR